MTQQQGSLQHCDSSIFVVDLFRLNDGATEPIQNQQSKRRNKTFQVISAGQEYARNRQWDIIKQMEMVKITAGNSPLLSSMWCLSGDY